MATAPFQLWVDLPAIISATRASSTVTIETTSAHGLVTGTYVQLEGLTGAAGTSMVGVYSATVTSTTKFTVSSAGSAGTATINTAVVSRDLFSPLIDIASANRQSAAYAVTEGISMSSAADGNSESMTLTVLQDDTPATGPWWQSCPDQARVRLCRTNTGSTPASTDLYFIGVIRNIAAKLNGSGQGTIATIAVDEVNAILDRLLVVGEAVSQVNPDGTGAFVRSSNVVTVTTNSDHGYYIGLQVQISGVLGGGANMNGVQTITSIPADDQFTYANTGANDTGGVDVKPSATALKSRSLQIVVVTFTSAHNLSNGDTVQLYGFSCSTPKFESQLNTVFGPTSMRVTSSTTLELTMATPLVNTQTVTARGYVSAYQKIIPTGKSESLGNYSIPGGLSEDKAVQAALAKVAGSYSKDFAVRRLIDIKTTTNITGAGSNSINGVGITMPAGSLRSILDGIVEAYTGEDTKERRYWIGLDGLLNYKLVNTTAVPTYATAPYKIITTGTQNPNTTTAAATLFPYSLEVAYDHNTIKQALFNIPSITGPGISKVQRYTSNNVGYTARAGAPQFGSVVEYPTSAADPSAAVYRAARSYFLEASKPLLTISFTIRGAGTQSFNQYGFSAGYYQTGASTFALNSRWEPGQWVSIVCDELGLNGLYRIETVNWTLVPGSFLQELAITANRRNPNDLVDIVKRRK